MDSPPSYHALPSVRISGRKASNVVGIPLARDTAPVHRSQVPPRLRKKFTPFVWDNANPFAYPPPLPSDAVQARIEHERQYESVGPLDPVMYYDFDSKYGEYILEEDDCDEEEYEEEYEDEYEGDEDSYDSGEDYGDADDEDDEEDYDSDAMDTDDSDSFIYRPLDMPIALPQLLHTVPLRYITSPIHTPLPSEVETRVPTPPMLLLYPSSESESETEVGEENSEKEEPSWAGLAAVYNNLAEAEERAARKDRRDAERSRAKVLAILGPEASSAL